MSEDSKKTMDYLYEKIEATGDIEALITLQTLMEIASKKSEKPIDKAKRELQGYKDILSKVWNEDLTDEQELIYLKFYRAGVKIGAIK